MRKNLCILLSILFIVSIFTVSSSAADALKGDIDGNGVVSMRDAFLVFEMLTYEQGEYNENMDIDNNNRISASDYRKISKVAINGKTKDTAVYYDLCEKSMFHSSVVLDDTIPAEYTDKISISESEDDFFGGVNHTYKVMADDLELLDNIVVLITFPENSVDFESDIYFSEKLSDIAVFDYKWLDGQLLVGMIFSREKSGGKILFSFSRNTSEGMQYVEPKFEVVEYNSYLNGNACFHSGGTATCSNAKICEYCGTEYGAKINHIGGTATCEKHAICEVCGVSYGEFAAHIGGSATCSEKAICEVCGQKYGQKAPHMNKTLSGACEVCGDDFSADISGINTSVIILNDYLLYTIYFTDVKSFKSLSFDFAYDPEVFFSADEAHYGDFSKADINFISGPTYLYQCDFVTADGYEIDEEMPILISFALYYSNAETFSYKDIPNSANFTFTDVIMTDNTVECTVNDVISVDSRHDHVDNDSDCFCDLCTELITDKNCTHADENYDCKCDYCSGPVFYYGDMNCDGKINASDARTALRISARIQETTVYALFVGDFDSDGRITASEARKILRVAARLDSF